MLKIVFPETLASTRAAASRTLALPLGHKRFSRRATVPMRRKIAGQGLSSIPSWQAQIRLLTAPWHLPTNDPPFFNATCTERRGITTCPKSPSVKANPLIVLSSD